MKVQINKNDSYASVLLTAKVCGSKKAIADALPMSDQQQRRLTAELVARGMPHLDAENGMFLTTDRWHVFLQHNKK